MLTTLWIVNIVLSLFEDWPFSNVPKYAKTDFRDNEGRVWCIAFCLCRDESQPSQPSLMWLLFRDFSFRRLRFWDTTMIADVAMYLICKYFCTFYFIVP